MVREDVLDRSCIAKLVTRPNRGTSARSSQGPVTPKAEPITAGAQSISVEGPRRTTETVTPAVKSEQANQNIIIITPNRAARTDRCTLHLLRSHSRISSLLKSIRYYPKAAGKQLEDRIPQTRKMQINTRLFYEKICRLTLLPEINRLRIVILPPLLSTPPPPAP